MKKTRKSKPKLTETDRVQLMLEGAGRRRQKQRTTGRVINKNKKRPDIKSKVSYEVLYDEETSEGPMTFYNEGFPNLKSAKSWLDERILFLKNLNAYRYINFRIVRHEVIDREKVVRRIKKL